ncbi:MAG: hypothetical protein H6613_19735 [Ignavibacteriales bacterium]|nr:hypothetical protein [Ignavibacteriales bacterium]
MGGANQLRGYYTNRFRGDEFLLGQLEYRWQFINRFSAVLFTDAGYMNKKLFNKLLNTWGFGLRFLLIQMLYSDLIMDSVKIKMDYFLLLVKHFKSQLSE